MSDEETYTYVVKLGIESPYASRTDAEDEFPLEDWGISDQAWDEMNDRDQDSLLEEAAQDNFWNSGYGYWGRVEK